MRWFLAFVALTSLSAAAATFAAACGGSTQTSSQQSTSDGGGGPETGVPVEAGAEAAPDAGPDVGYPGPHYPMPQVVNIAGGVTLKTPKVYLIFYPGYAYEAQLKAMGQAIGATSYWKAATSEYGVGAVQYAGSIELTGETPPTSIQDSQIQTYLGGNIASGAFGTPDTSTIYTIVYPSTTSITLPSGGPFGNATSCQSFGGYHQDFLVSLTDGGAQQDFPYAVIPTCPNGLQGLTEVAAVTGALSHEWAEAATDPYPASANGTNSAYAQVDENHFAWELLGGGGEVGDMCVGEANAFYAAQDVGATVQRIWSNASAKHGHDPCVPNVPGTVYFQSAPMLTDNISFTSQFIGGTVQTQGLTIPVGQSKTVEVDLFSDGPTSGPWTVAAEDALAKLLGGTPSLGFQWDKTQGQNGDKLQLTLTVKTADSLFGGAHPFIVTSTLGTQTNAWAGLVVE
jgi:hypothetical protein